MEEEKSDEPSMKEILKKIADQQEMMLAGKKEKAFKLPWKSRTGKAAVKKGYATVCVINENRSVNFKKIFIDGDGAALLDKFPRVASADYTLIYNGKPFYIIPSWSMKPFSPVENYEQTKKENMHVLGRRLVLSKLEGEKIKPKGAGFGMIGWIILGAIVIGAIYFLTKGGGKLF